MNKVKSMYIKPQAEALTTIPRSLYSYNVRFAQEGLNGRPVSWYNFFSWYNLSPDSIQESPLVKHYDE